MKKLLSLATIFVTLLTLLLTTNVYAAALDTIDATLDKTTVHPGTDVTLTINFGKALGAYTFDIAYDNSLFEFVSASDGTPSDSDTKVRVVYYDSTGGSNPKESLSVVFKSKDGITTSNPTNFAITAEGLANPDASEQYDDITIPISKNVIVEPDYKDYELKLEYDGEIIENKEKEITISTISEMGRYYDHARLIAEATTPDGGSVSLIGTDSAQMEYDLIKNGWGDEAGYEIGGKVEQVLKFTGLFTKAGDYTITLKLIDRDAQDASIAEKTFNIKVASETAVETPEEKPAETPEEEATTEKVPEELPKTGINLIVIGFSIIALLVLTYVSINRKKD